MWININSGFAGFSVLFAFCYRTSKCLPQLRNSHVTNCTDNSTEVGDSCRKQGIVPGSYITDLGMVEGSGFTVEGRTDSRLLTVNLEP